MSINTIISGTGSKLPDQVIPNSNFSDHQFYGKDGSLTAKTTGEVIAKLEEISGIKSRRYIPDDEDSVPLMTSASTRAIKDSGLDKNQIDGIIVAHNAGNMRTDGLGWEPVPNLASLVKNSLQIKNYDCFAYDILFGCPGWIQGLIQAHYAIVNGDANHVLVIGIEVASRLLDPHDVDSMLLGDGCGAAILSKSENDDKIGVLGYTTFSHCQEDCRTIFVGQSNNPALKEKILFKMNGKEVYRYATTWVPQVIKKTLDKLELSVEDIDLFLFHQANGKMLTAIAKNLGKLYNQDLSFFNGKIPSTIEFTGNTSVATIPTMLDLIQNKKLDNYEIKSGQKIIMASVGAGMHCNAIVYQF
ncbi:MAG: ketoacyl-ACP synthase III [Candidatus Marinimicrobia bacterium]|nr:ketoacyl-ACP synthase III [Candidatus Neomarinimicrobiota bacterium]